ncbi:hypothetical protein EDC04DRAFT_2758214 [Pisolithus marmoratus]|nr:hypothetical protein EDC04DRAFT_2758214 [Pisolithus marmoratus]
MQPKTVIVIVGAISTLSLLRFLACTPRDSARSLVSFCILASVVPRVSVAFLARNG